MTSYLARDALPLPAAFRDSPADDYANALMAFSKKYTWLANIHTVDFFTMDYWHMMDPEWTDALLSDAVGYPELMRLASFSECMEPWPDSIKQFVREALDLALLRDVPSDYNDDGFVASIDKHILPGMTEKKLHEVEILSGLIAQVSKETGVSSVIDLGAGQGYLSRALAFQHDLHVLAIDSCSIQTCGAQRYQEMAEKTLSKSSQKRKQSSSTARPYEENNVSTSTLTLNAIPSDRPSTNASNLHHITQEVTFSSLPTLLTDWSTSTFWHQSTATSTANTDTRARWLLCGLHACGDLSSHMIQLFLGSDDVRCLVNVGCCYHSLSEGLEDEGATEPRFAFPMSRHFQAAQFKMGATARMLACQAPSRWSERQESTVKSFEHHFFRALLRHGRQSPSHRPVEQETRLHFLRDLLPCGATTAKAPFGQYHGRGGAAVRDRVQASRGGPADCHRVDIPRVAGARARERCAGGPVVRGEGGDAVGECDGETGGQQERSMDVAAVRSGDQPEECGDCGSEVRVGVGCVKE
ncbi:methyltransferase domain-containing protein [Jimgerdemannia flammicorona]|uniref:Methyltransferase domain-containing protein n=1 Tax=Jimgerdemannia flammicorona TaxID=994334 RepID=A0A433CXD1_9FUNG|nr:methyltransferase domain-containing protein [Jimgerdemannia flammicorona]